MVTMDDQQSDLSLSLPSTLRRQQATGRINQSISNTLPPIESSTLLQFADVGQRGFSRKLHEMVKQQKLKTDDYPTARGGVSKLKVSSPRQKFELKNWKQYTPAQMNKMTLMERSRYMMYEPPDKDILEKQMQSIQRVRARQLKEKSTKEPLTLKEMIAKEENSELIGQLKAAEARQRIRNTHIMYEAERAEELQHLISSQLTAQEAVRLQSFIPPSPLFVNVPDYLTKSQRKRCEELLEDELGLTTNRT